ncbi:MAG TPA: PqqD family protein [Thermoanaerobaculia bacterium]|nr:PqqD family protein [Thermoanaerobaculia bacterium]
MITLTTVLRRHPGVRFRVLDGQAVVLQQEAAEVMVLDEIATRILTLADGVVPVSLWVDVLSREYDVARDVLERDLLDFGEELMREGLLEAVAPASQESPP